MLFICEPKELLYKTREDYGGTCLYLEVKSKHNPDGIMIPDSFIWVDGIEYKIEKIRHITKGRSLKQQTTGTRFRCVASETEFDLFFTGEAWYIEV